MMVALAVSQRAFGMTNSALQTLTKDNTAFALDLYQRVRAKEGNLFFSPFSISIALAMTYMGARGQTESDLAKALHFGVLKSELPGAYAALAERLADIRKEKQLALNVANSLWCQRDYPFTKEFLNLNRQYFDAEVGLVDFANESDAARKQINAWVARKTEDKIKDLLAPNTLDPMSRLVLCNAIYFKGDWAQQFEPIMTRPADFFVSPGRKVQTPIMFREAAIKGRHFDDVSVFELGYKGAALSMIVILPDVLDGLGKLENRLNPTRLARWLGDLNQSKATNAIIFLPKFKMTSQFNLAQTLATMGMSSAFNEGTADFSGMTGNRKLFISAVTHAAIIEVNEEGTESAAATMQLAVEGIHEGPIFRADHPFLFLIRENQTGSILFLGRVVDPTK